MELAILLIVFASVATIFKVRCNLQQNQYEPPTENRLRNARNRLNTYLSKVENELIEPSYNDGEYISVVEQALLVLEKAKVVIDTSERCSTRFLEELDASFDMIDDLILTGKSRARELSQGV